MSTAQHPPPVSAATPNSVAGSIRGRLLVRDIVTFLALTTVTVVLFFITLFLFRSFEVHQQQLAHRWSDRGRAELAAGRPDQAVDALRAALTYAPGERSYQLLLAQALGDAGRTEESFTYFSGLWDAQPGDGFINLRLARLAAGKGDRDQAVNFYRAAIYGTWPGDAILRRQGSRIELANYLVTQKEPAAAREELLIAGSNAGHDAAFEARLAGLLAQAGSPGDALTYDNKALADDPHNIPAAVDAAHLSLDLGNFPQARSQIERAIRIADAARPQPASLPALRQMRSDLDRLLALNPAPNLPPSERVNRLLADAAIARTRLAGCLVTTAGNAPSSLAGLTGRWSAAAPLLNRRTLLSDPDLQESALDLIFTTETATAAAPCGNPTGDDALLLHLAQQHAAAAVATQQPEPQQP